MKKLLPSIAASLAFSVSSAHAANVVVNGDFSVNGALFTDDPGYVAGNPNSPLNPAAIANWTSNNIGSGVNGVGISTPFGPSDQSAATYYGFLQGVGTQMSQILTLAPNTTYDISFVAGNRASNPNANGRVTVADNTTTYYDSTSSNWGTAAFLALSSQFSTGASFDGNVVMTLMNTSPGGDNTVNYSNIVVDAVPVPEPATTALLGLGGIALLLRRRK